MTVEEVLKASGMTDEQIKALDAKVMQGFTGVITAAETAKTEATKALEAAELAKRAQLATWNEQINPALDKWANEKANIEAERNYYKTLAEKAKEGGFVPSVEPFKPTTTTPAQDPNTGKFVPGPTGSPVYMTQEQGFAAVTNASWLISEHMRLYGTPPPDEIEQILRESTEQRMPFRDYASRKYKFEEKKTALAGAKQKEHDDAIRKEVAAAKDKEWAEKVGNNPMVRPAVSSQFAQVEKAVKAGERKDPLTMTKTERHQYTQGIVNKEIAENESKTVQ
jgi:hypothetical protein